MYRGNWIMAQMIRRLALGLITSRQFHIKNLLYFTLPTNFQYKYHLRGRNLGGGGRDICCPPRNDAYGYEHYLDPREYLGLGALATGQVHRYVCTLTGSTAGSHVEGHMGSTLEVTLSSRAVRMVVEGYPPDESLQWDETTHISSL